MSRINSKSIVVWSLTLIVLGGVGFLLVKRLTPPPQPNFNMAALVSTQPVKVQSLQVTYETTGTIEAKNVVDLKPETAGKVVRIAFVEGQRVAPGQVLVSLHGDKQAAQLRESAASINVSRSVVDTRGAEIERLKTDAEAALARKRLADSEYSRFQQLYKDQFISAIELEQRRTQAETANAAYQSALKQVTAAQAALRQASAGVAAARSAYGYTRAVASDNIVEAPFSGIVGQKYIAPGDYVQPGQKLLTLVDTSEMKVNFAVPEKYIGYLRQGLPVNMKVQSMPGKNFTGDVIFIDPAVDMETRNVTVKARIASGAESLKPGQFGQVSLTLGTKGSAMVVPEESLVAQGEKFFVYVAKDGKAHLQEIKVGQRRPGTVEVVSGLAPTDRIIVGGLQKLQDGGPIMEAGNMKPGGAPGAQPGKKGA